MVPAPFVVVVDANVLFPLTLRDTILRAAAAAPKPLSILTTTMPDAQLVMGDEQSGHIKEVGVELYQHLLEEAVAAARAGETGAAEAVAEEAWSPQINTGAAVLIPEEYVPDLNVRLALYRRLLQLPPG